MSQSIAVTHSQHMHSDRIDEANRLLAVTGALGARWWYYTASLASFELVVGEPSGESNIILVMASCISIAGPTSWGNQRLQVRSEASSAGNPGATVFELRDESVGFIARANMFTFKQGWDLLEFGSVIFPQGHRSENA